MPFFAGSLDPGSRHHGTGEMAWYMVCLSQKYNTDNGKFVALVWVGLQFEYFRWDITIIIAIYAPVFLAGWNHLMCTTPQCVQA